MRRIFVLSSCYQLLQCVAEYVEILGPFVSGNCTSLTLDLLRIMINNNANANANDNNPTDHVNKIQIPSSLWLHITAFLANALAHRRLANDYIEYNGLEILHLLGKCKYLSLIQSELSVCLHSLSSHDSAMEQIIRSSDNFNIVFQLSLQLLRCSDEYTYRYALLFFIEALAFPPFLTAFDEVFTIIIKIESIIIHYP